MQRTHFLGHSQGCRSLSLVLLDIPLSISLEYFVLQRNMTSEPLSISRAYDLKSEGSSVQNAIPFEAVATNIRKYRCVQIYPSTEKSDDPGVSAHICLQRNMRTLNFIIDGIGFICPRVSRPKLVQYKLRYPGVLTRSLIPRLVSQSLVGGYWLSLITIQRQQILNIFIVLHRRIRYK